MKAAVHHMRRDEAGMTLVEVMLVLFIIGLASTLVVFTLPPQESPARKTANDLAQTLQLAQDRAILTGSSVGVTVDESTIQTAIWRGGDWQVDRQTQSISGAVRVRRLGMTDDGADPTVPTLTFDPTGVNEDLLFRIDGRREDIDLTFTALGEVQIETR